MAYRCYHQYLLDVGAVCEEDTYMGERCFYAGKYDVGLMVSFVAYGHDGSGKAGTH